MFLRTDCRRMILEILSSETTYWDSLKLSGKISSLKNEKDGFKCLEQKLLMHH